jgi:CBS domain-containing protein
MKVEERDILRAVGEGRDPENTPVAAFMVEDPVSVGLDAEAAAAAETMVRLGVRHLPVMDRGELVGMLSARDLLEDEAAKALVE